jgi:prolyl oligopeptidase
VTKDGRYLILMTRTSGHRGYSFAYRDTAVTEDGFTPFIVNATNKFSLICNIGSRLYFLTDYGADRFHVVTLDIGVSGAVLDTSSSTPFSLLPHLTIVLPESKVVIAAVSCANHNKHLIVRSLVDVQDVIDVYNMDGSLVKRLDMLPAFGCVRVSSDAFHHEVFFQCTSFMDPGTSYVYDLMKHELCLFREVKLDGFCKDDYRVEQVFYESADATRVPMFIVTQKVTLPGKNPEEGDAKEMASSTDTKAVRRLLQTMLLYGYGGFNNSQLPFFSSVGVVRMTNLGVGYALANIRGGGEYGKQWHTGGSVLQKRHSFEDFIGAAEYLVKHEYTIIQATRCSR